MPRSTASASDETVTGFKALEEATIAIEAESESAADAAESAAVDAPIHIGDEQVGLGDRAASTFGNVLDLASQSAEETLAELKSGNLASPKQSNLASEFVQLTRETISLQKSAFARLVACRSPGQLLSLQLDITRETVSGMSEASKRLSQASLKDFSQLSSKMAAVAR